VLEKVAHLLGLLEALGSHPFLTPMNGIRTLRQNGFLQINKKAFCKVLKGKLTLKGGTALNLFVFNVPRLSVEIDLTPINGISHLTKNLLKKRAIIFCK
jgi:hypothetical protein